MPSVFIERVRIGTISDKGIWRYTKNVMMKA